MLAVLVIILITYFLIRLYNKYNKDIFIGVGVGCAAVLIQFTYGIIILIILIWVVGLFSG